MSKIPLNTKNEITVALIGLGGLGCPALLAICRNWAQATNNKKLNLKLIDHDHISLSNLSRQILFSSKTVSEKKIDVALSSVTKNTDLFNSNIRFTKICQKLNSNTLNQYLNDTDVILDCTDDPELKIKLNQYAVFNKKPLIYGGVLAFSGIVFSIIPGGPCINCVFGNFEHEELCELGGTCSTGGVVGGIAGIIGYLQTENLFALLRPVSRTSSHQIKFVNSFGQIRQVVVAPNLDCIQGCGKLSRKTIDLTSFQCPETFLYSKLALEKIKKEHSHNFVELKFKRESDLLNVNESLIKEGYLNNTKTISNELSEYRLIISLPEV